MDVVYVWAAQLPVDYAYDVERELATITATGPVTLQERVACVDRLLADPSTASRRRVLIDVTGVSTTPTPEEVYGLGVLVSRLQHRRGCRVAIVNTTPGHVTLTAMVAVYAEVAGTATRGFLSSRDALAWLHHDESHAEQDRSD